MHDVILRYLQEVARCGSIRKAAQALNVNSSAVNRQILKLEAELQTKLFDRLSGGVTVTAAGEVLLRHVRETLQGYERATAEMAALRGLRSGHVNIATLDSLMLSLLPDVLREFSERYPAVTFSVSAESPADVLRKLGSGEADLGLTFVAPIGSALAEVVSVPAPVGAVMRSDHPLAKHQSLTFDDLLPYPALLQQSTLPQSLLAGHDYARFRERVTQRFTSNDIDFIKRMLRTGSGVGLYTRFAFQEEIAAGELIWAGLEGLGIAELRMGLFVPAHRSATPACQALTNVIAQALRGALGGSLNGAPA